MGRISTLTDILAERFGSFRRYGINRRGGILLGKFSNEVPELVQFQRIIVNVDIFGYVETEQYNIFVLTGSNGISKERK